MLKRRRPIWVKEAIDQVMEYKQRGAEETVSIDDCDGRYLSASLIADHDVPPFNRSPYDGFALRSIDTKTASRDNPLSFKVIDEVGAGHVSSKQVGPMEVIRIMTGAQIPAGADCVVMLELVQEVQHGEQSFIQLRRQLKKDDNISFQGEDTQKGNLLIHKGEIINPGIKALLATFGYSEVKVAKKPIVGVIVTGTELLRPEDELVPGKIRNSNGYMIESQIIRAGGEYKRYELCEDHLENLYDAIMKARNECDFVITTGGVSVGDYDYLPKIYEQLDANILFNKVAMRPGSVTSCVEIDGQLLFGLSGNPSACYVGFELFVRPYIKYWLYSNKPHTRKISGKLKVNFPKANPFTRFVRGRLVYEDGEIYAEPVGLDKSGVVTSTAWANCLIVLSAGTKGYIKDDQIDILLLEDNNGSDVSWQEKRFSKSSAIKTAEKQL